MDKYDKLKELKELFDNGLLGEDEFADLKNEILFKNNKDNSVPNQTTTPNYQNEDVKSKKGNIGTTILFTFLGIALFVIIKKSFTSSNISPVATEINASSKSSETDNSLTDYSNECSICGRNFTGKGYEEISAGNWQPLQEGQSFICSVSCGKSTQDKYDKILSKYGYGSQQGTNQNGDYHMGNDGRVYENKACSLCKGTGIETGRNIVTGEVEGRICPMCDGRGVRSY